MPKRPHIPDEQLGRLRARHQAEQAALASHGAAIERLDAAETRRAKVVAEQDAVVAAAREEVRAALLHLASICGDETAAELTGTPIPIRRPRAKKDTGRLSHATDVEPAK